MPEITIEDKKINFVTSEDIVSTDVQFSGESYKEINQVIRTCTSEIYSYPDYTALFSSENLFNENYVKIILFNAAEQKGYKLKSISANLNINVKRFGKKNFIVFGINKYQSTLGEVAFCQLQDSGEVNETSVTFNYLKQVMFLNEEIILLNTVEVTALPNSDKVSYISTVTLYKITGKIFKVLVDFKSDKETDIKCNVENSVVTIINNTDGENKVMEEYKIESCEKLEGEPSKTNGEKSTSAKAKVAKSPKTENNKKSK